MVKTEGRVQGRAVANNSFVEAILSQRRALDLRLTLILPDPVYPERIHEAYPHCDLTELDMVQLRWLPGFLAAQRVDALHLLGPQMYTGMYIRNVVAGYPFPVTGVTHSLGHDTFHLWLTMSLWARPRPYDCLVCTTPTAEQVVQELVASVSQAHDMPFTLPTHVIPLGIGDECFQPAPPAPLPVIKRERTYVLLSLARFSYLTKVDSTPALVALRRLRASGMDVHWVMAGAEKEAGRFLEHLRQTAAELGVAEHLTLLPNIDEDTKRGLMHRADAFVALGDNPQETFGLSVVEAMAAGLPVIASDWNGYRAIVRHRENGLLVPTLGLPASNRFGFPTLLRSDALNHLLFSQGVATDLDALVAAIREVLTDAPFRARLSQGARESAQRLRWSSVLESYRTLWQERCALARADHEPLPKLPAALDFPRAFQSYPARALSDEVFLRRTKEGQAVLEGQQALRIVAHMRDFFDAAVVSDLLAHTESWVRLADLIQRLAGHSPDAVGYFSVWLCKYGLLEWRDGA